jgi:hypothetical protein
MSAEFDYKKYSIKNLQEWVHDALSISEASPQEIYSAIREAVREDYYCYKNQVSRASELLALLNGNGKNHLSCDKDDTSPECKQSWNSFWEDTDGVEDEVQKWVLPVEVDDANGEYFVTFPDDLLEKVGWKEGDTVEYVPSENGFYVMRKVNVE